MDWKRAGQSEECRVSRRAVLVVAEAPSLVAAVPVACLLVVETSSNRLTESTTTFVLWRRREFLPTEFEGNCFFSADCAEHQLVSGGPSDDSRETLVHRSRAAESKKTLPITVDVLHRRVVLCLMPAGLTWKFDSFVVFVPRDQIDYVGRLLATLPRESSVVITSAERLLVELFTHHGP